MRDSAPNGSPTPPAERSPPRSRRGSGTAENIDVPDQQPAPSFGDNSLAGADSDADPESEVAAFANREQGRDGKLRNQGESTMKKKLLSIVALVAASDRPARPARKTC
jgi:hypothetical protein